MNLIYGICDKTVSIAGLWVTIDGSVLETITQSAAGVSNAGFR